MIDFIPSSIASGLSLFLNISMSLLLLIMSIDDVKYTRIKAKHVMIFYIMVMTYIVINDLFSPKTTTSFIIILVTFTCIAYFSKGKFGMGDALLLGALGWYFSGIGKINMFLYVWAGVSILWAVYWIIYFYKKSDIRDIVLGFKRKIPITELKAGMILSNDNFVKGITSKEIYDLKQNGVTEVEIKKPLPYIPVFFVTSLIAFLV